MGGSRDDSQGAAAGGSGVWGGGSAEHLLPAGRAAGEPAGERSQRHRAGACGVGLLYFIFPELSIAAWAGKVIFFLSFFFENVKPGCKTAMMNGVAGRPEGAVPAAPIGVAAFAQGLRAARAGKGEERSCTSLFAS